MVLELKNRPSPKSPSLTTPVAVMNTFAGLISVRKMWIYYYQALVNSLFNVGK